MKWKYTGKVDVIRHIQRNISEIQIIIIFMNIIFINMNIMFIKIYIFGNKFNKSKFYSGRN